MKLNLAALSPKTTAGVIELINSIRCPLTVMEDLSIVEASIEDIRSALASNAITSVELVAKYLCRVAKYDCRGPSFNAVPNLNPEVFEEAAASDDRRMSGLPVRPLEGIPYTVKDSYKVRGMTVACGSPAFKDLVSSEDAFTVGQLRAAGAVLIGKFCEFEGDGIME